MPLPARGRVVHAQHREHIREIETHGLDLPRNATHPRVDARQWHKSIPRIYRGIDVKSQFPPPLAWSMTPTAEHNCSSKNLDWSRQGCRQVFWGEVHASAKSSPTALT